MPRKTPDVTRKTPNRLAEEKSPYLLQHAYNPVDWYAWSDEAFEKAAREDKPIFLSIGYATCHWCHVMERESFEDDEVAAILNRDFISIKVDREERPDVDSVYMTACQALNGRGGWPLTALLTPEKEPFFAATYIPREARGGMMGLVGLLTNVTGLWSRDRGRLRESAGKLVQSLQTVSSSWQPGELPASVFSKTVDALHELYDEAHGGFGTAPKFPTPHQLIFLLGRHRRSADINALRMTTQTLDSMRAGGLWDHLGHGFHRYSTDRKWLVPHFEKMLYDQAGLATAYLVAHQLTGSKLYADTARQTLDYVLGFLSDPGGGFHCGEDADSEGEEGRHYVWSAGEIEEVLGEEVAREFLEVYGVTGEGNFLDEATKKKTGANILHLPAHCAAVSGRAEKISGIEERFAAQRKTLLAHRAERVRPLTDDKVLTAWSGMIASALALGATVLDAPAYLERAREAVDFIWDEMLHDTTLLRRYREGSADIEGFAEDYAYTARAFLDIYEAGFAAVDLERAVTVAGWLRERFVDGEGVLHDTAHEGEELIMRPRDVADGAYASAFSVALEVFARLGVLLEDEGWTQLAQGLLNSAAGTAPQHSTAFCHYLQGASLLLEPTRHVTVYGSEKNEDTRLMLDTLKASYAPETMTLFKGGGGGGEANAVVCENFTCAEPIEDVGVLEEIIKKPPTK